MSWSDAAPLAGIKVLDLCRVVSGPFATMQLGDLGADVVKIEQPEHGDESRTYGPPFLGGESAYFLSVDRNKRSSAIDLKSPAGKDRVRSRLHMTAERHQARFAQTSGAIRFLLDRVPVCVPAKGSFQRG
jgi:crotonobetainyl-CoA:carnitine CoA-transferase CaiB-like acyl-CoA transferase